MAGLTLASTMVGAMGISDVNADTETPSAAVANSVTDKTSKRTLIIHKYKVDSLADQQDRGDGERSPKDVANADKYKPLEGVDFEIVRVKAKGTAALVDPATQPEGDWEVDPTFTAIKQTTGADGTATFDISAGLGANEMDKNDGTYLVKETGATDKELAPLKPFFVHIPQTSRKVTNGFLYEVNVYPKNVTDMNLTPEKHIITEESADHGGSVVTGQKFKWQGTSNVPTGLWYKAATALRVEDYNDDGTPADPAYKDIAAGEEVYAHSFRIIDDMDENLIVDKAGIVVEYSVDGTTNWQPLTLNSDYELKSDTTTVAPKEKITVDVKQPGMLKLAQAGGLVAGTTDTYKAAKKIRVTYPAQVKPGYNGTITNKLQVTFNTPGTKPKDETTTPEVTPNIYSGGFEIEKVDAQKNDTKLEGAIFKVAESEEKAYAGDFIKDPDSGEDLTATSNTDGVATFNGLALNVDESGKPADKDYFVVETTAPEGYELAAKPVKVTVNLTTSDSAYTLAEDGETKVPNEKKLEGTVYDKKKTVLPFTGGNGTTLLIVIAMGAISIGTAAVVIDKKRRQA